jgi:hypothetical protein
MPNVVSTNEAGLLLSDRAKKALSGDSWYNKVESIDVFSRIVSDPLPEHERKLRAAVSDILFVDGVAHEKVGRPVYSVDECWGANLAGGYDNGSVQYGYVVPAERFDDVIAMLKASKYYRKDANEYKHMRPDIVRPDLLAFDERKWVVEGAARSAVRSMSTSRSNYSRNKSCISFYPRDLIMAYAHLRDGVAAGASVPELANLLAGFRDAAESHGTLRDEYEAADIALKWYDSSAPDEDIANILGSI